MKNPFEEIQKNKHPKPAPESKKDNPTINFDQILLFLAYEKVPKELIEPFLNDVTQARDEEDNLVYLSSDNQHEFHLSAKGEMRIIKVAAGKEEILLDRASDLDMIERILAEKKINPSHIAGLIAGSNKEEQNH